MTSIVREVDRDRVTMDGVIDSVSRGFGQVFGLEVRRVSAELLEPVTR